MEQIVKFGDNYISYLSEFLSNILPKKIFLVTGKRSYISCGAKERVESLLADYNYLRFCDFDENPKVEDVERGIKLFNDNDCEVIIAIGGGSVLDMAKLINIYHSTSNSLIDCIKSGEKGKTVVPFVAIPTTSGSGSEATHFAVVYIDKKKYSVADKLLLPNLVLLNPTFSYSASPYLTAVTGLDAFAQAIESYWSVNSTYESQRYSEEAIKILWENLLSAVNENCKKAKNKISRASHLAGKAINISKTTAPHAFSYGFTTNFKLPHGHAVSLFLPFFIDYHINVNADNCNDKRGEKWVRNMMKCLAKNIGVEVGYLSQSIADFIKRCNIQIAFKNLKIDEIGFYNAIGEFSEERLKNNPLKVTDKTVSSIYNCKYNKLKEA